MRSYGKVYGAFWSDERTATLSDRGKVLALYLLTGPHSNAIGCYRLPIGYIAEDLRWSIETVTETVSELLSKAFINRCPATSWIFIPRFLKHNAIENPNVAKALRSIITAVPKTLPFYQELVDSLKPYAERFPEGFLNSLGNGMSNQSRSKEPSPAQPNPAQSEPKVARVEVAKPEANDPALATGERVTFRGECPPDDFARMLDELGCVAEHLSESAGGLVSSFTRQAVAGKLLSASQRLTLAEIHREARVPLEREAMRRLEERFSGCMRATEHREHGPMLAKALLAGDEAEITRLMGLVRDDLTRDPFIDRLRVVRGAA